MLNINGVAASALTTAIFTSTLLNSITLPAKITQLLRPLKNTSNASMVATTGTPTAIQVTNKTLHSTPGTAASEAKALAVMLPSTSTQTTVAMNTGNTEAADSNETARASPSARTARNAVAVNIAAKVNSVGPANLPTTTGPPDAAMFNTRDGTVPGTIGRDAHRACPDKVNIISNSTPLETSIPVSNVRVASIANIVHGRSSTQAGSSRMHADMAITSDAVRCTGVDGDQEPTSTTNAVVPSNFSGVVDAHREAERNATREMRSFCRPLHTVRRNKGAQQPSRHFGIAVTRTVDVTRLDGRHDWVSLPVSDMNFNRYVSENSTAREDMVRFWRFMANVGRQAAIDVWAKFSGAHPWFVIPTTVVSSRTFARDELEVHYVDCMDRLTKCLSSMDVQVSLKVQLLPLVLMGDALVSRWWNQPRAVAWILQEQEFMHYHGIMYAFDSFDYLLVDEYVQSVWEIYPETPCWWSVIWFPAGVPCPMPPSVFYYHNCIRSAWRDERHAHHNLWWDVVQLEYAALYAATWWHEAARGHRGFLIPEDTIVWLEDMLGDLAIDPDTAHGPAGQTSFPWIASRMRQLHGVNSRYRNRLSFPCTHLPPSFFIWTGYATGFPNLNEAGGRHFARGYNNGHIYEKGVHANKYGTLPRINRRQPQPEGLFDSGGYGRVFDPSGGRDDLGIGRGDCDAVPHNCAINRTIHFRADETVGNENGYEGQQRAPRRLQLNDRSDLEVNHTPIGYDYLPDDGFGGRHRRYENEYRGEERGWRRQSGTWNEGEDNGNHRRGVGGRQIQEVGYRDEDLRDGGPSMGRRNGWEGDQNGRHLNGIRHPNDEQQGPTYREIEYGGRHIDEEQQRGSRNEVNDPGHALQNQGGRGGVWNGDRHRVGNNALGRRDRDGREGGGVRDGYFGGFQTYRHGYGG